MIIRALKYSIITLGLLLNSSGLRIPENAQSKPKKVSILALGDSITKGGDDFFSYLFPLHKLLHDAHYDVDFVGPVHIQHNGVTLRCAGYSGKNTEFLAQRIDVIYPKYKADVVLIHSGHNHFNKDKPVDDIVLAHKSIIKKIKEYNPSAVIILAQVIPSGKLPKYEYITRLNKELKQLVTSLNDQSILIVDQSKGFTWEKDTISDKVHPNKKGSEKMAKIWFAELTKILRER